MADRTPTIQKEREIIKKSDSCNLSHNNTEPKYQL